MFDLVQQINRTRTAATGAGVQILMGSGTTNTAVSYVQPFKSGSEVMVVHSLAASGDATWSHRYLISGDHGYHAVLASGNNAYYWIAVGPKVTQ